MSRSENVTLKGSCIITVADPPAFVAGTNSGAFLALAYAGAGRIQITLQPGYLIEPSDVVDTQVEFAVGAEAGGTATVASPNPATLDIRCFDNALAPADSVLAVRIKRRLTV